MNTITSICVLDWRYGSRELRRLLSPQNIIDTYIRVEKALVKALAKTGIIPSKCYYEIDKCGNVSAEEVYELEKRTGHDIASLTILLASKCGECGKYIHLGATSYDIVDTAWALILREALRIIEDKLKRVIRELIELAEKHRNTLMPGRTHGQHALPITLGFKFANYVYELSRSLERLCELKKRLIKGKISGAVGTMAAWGKHGLGVESETLRILGLSPHPITTQVAPRDGYAELASIIAILGSQLDRLALEVRELSRPEIGELYEAVERIGSSTMPHKRNPVVAERISGLAKTLRGLVVSAIENIVLMHERDLTNSSLERILIPHILLVIDQALEDTLFMLENLGVNAKAMKRNLGLTKGLILSEAVMVKLVEKGLPRHEAHSIVLKLARRSEEEGKEFKEILLSDEVVAKYLSREEVEEALNPLNYLGSCDRLISRAIDYAEEVLRRC